MTGEAKASIFNPVILILAAGQSQRLGFPKQLVTFNDVTLIETITTRLDALCPGSVFCALGAHFHHISPHIPDATHIVQCGNWQKGMGTTLSDALKNILQTQTPTHMLIALCDQFLVPFDHYKALLHASHENPERIIATQTDPSQSGMVPVIFPHRYFESLIRLHGDKGARSLLSTLPEDEVNYITCKEALVDLDKPDDLMIHPSLKRPAEISNHDQIDAL